MSGHRQRLALPVLLQSCQLPRRIVHGKRFRLQVPVSPHILLRHPDGASHLQVIEKPDRIGTHQVISLPVQNHKIPVAVDSLKIIGIGGNHDGLPQRGAAVKNDLPGGKPPGLSVFCQVTHSNSHVLRLKSGAVLKIIDGCRHRQRSVHIRLAVPHTAVKGIHGYTLLSFKLRQTIV